MRAMQSNFHEIEWDVAISSQLQTESACGARDPGGGGGGGTRPIKW